MNLNQLTLSIAATQSDKYFVSKDRYDQLIEEKMDLEDALGSYKSTRKEPQNKGQDQIYARRAFYQSRTLYLSVHMSKAASRTK